MPFDLERTQLQKYINYVCSRIFSKNHINQSLIFWCQFQIYIKIIFPLFTSYQISNCKNLKQLVRNFENMFHQQKNQSPNRTTILHQQTTLLPNNQDQQSAGALKDSLISLQFRIKTLESQVNLKMERQQCFTLMERKCNNSYVKKCFQELYTKLQSDRLNDETHLHRMEQEQKNKINDLKRKLKEVNTRQVTEILSPVSKDNPFSMSENISKKINKALLKPQQLYLESNETMFSMIIDQVKELKQRDLLIERLIQSKHKKTVSLNNQVCRKLEYLQSQLQQTIKYIDSIQSKNYLSQKQTFTDPKKSIKKSTSKSNQIRQYGNQRINSINSQNQAFELIRLQLLSKSIESIQKQLSHKLNIKDIVPLIKQNLPSFQQHLSQIKGYVQSNFESMRKILSNQSQINQEISKANKVAWWHCYQKIQVQGTQRSQTNNEIGYILFNKQIMNIIPECLSVQENYEHILKITSKGWYFVNVFGLSIQSERQDQIEGYLQGVWIQINNGIRQNIRNNKLLNLPVGAQIKLITQKQDLFVQVQKL